ncbi:hypothetical protein HDU97_005212 [Phlyctochytrium planicorne]|nr:hypothetical protein HDU97_005212 [Phlyctochytrium planicorne]
MDELSTLSSVKTIDLDDLGRISLDIRRPRDEDDMDEVELSAPPRSVMASAAEMPPLPPNLAVDTMVRQSGTYQSVPNSASQAQTQRPVEPASGGYKELDLHDDEEEDPGSANLTAQISSFLSTIKPKPQAVPTTQYQPDRIEAPSTMVARTDTMNSEEVPEKDKVVLIDDEEGWARFRRAVGTMQFLNAGNLCGAGNSNCLIQ